MPTEIEIASRDRNLAVYGEVLVAFYRFMRVAALVSPPEPVRQQGIPTGANESPEEDDSWHRQTTTVVSLRRSYDRLFL